MNRKRKTVVASTISILALVLTTGGSARADFTFGLAQSMGPVLNSPSNDGTAGASADGLELYFGSDRPGGYGASDIWVSTRQSIKDSWGPPTNLGPTVNSAYSEGYACLSSDGLTLYFSDFYSGTPRPGGLGGADIWMTARPSRRDPWSTPVSVGAPINSPALDFAPTISADSLTLIFTSNRSGGMGGWDLWMSTRASTQDAWGPPVNLGPNVNSASHDCECSLSADGLALFFCSNRAGGVGAYDLWVTTRTSSKSSWGLPVNLGSAVNTTANEGSAGVFGNMGPLYFTTDRSGGLDGYELWQAPILPVVDLNGDGKVEATDLDLLLGNWAQNKPLCDIGPSPWGDGVVDEQDLRVLTELTMTPGPRAADVPGDVILRWISPSLAERHDVYFGTSFEAVNAASRTDPLAVLVSQGQTATTYDPEGILELGRTYYWRVDFVSAGPEATIYRGPVLDFTTESRLRISTIVATASSAQPSAGPEKTVDGSGLDASGGHSTEQKDMWLSVGAVPGWIQYEFDRIYPLRELWVWNYNSPSEPSFGFGARRVKIEHSVDGVAWTVLEGVPEFARAPGKPGYTANTTVSFGGVSAKFVKLTITKNWGIAPRTGLSEVRFFYSPDGSGSQTLVDKLMGMVEAHNRHDWERELSFFTEDARFEMVGAWVKEGKAELRKLFELDVLLGSQLTFTDFQVEADTVTCKVEEQTELHTLLGLKAIYYEYSQTTFRDGLIEETRAKLSAESMAACDRQLATFLEWATQNRANALPELRVGKGYDITAANVDKWLQLLREWQESQNR